MCRADCSTSTCLDNMSAFDFRDACEAGDLDKAKGLIKSVDINETDEYGFTALHMASENGHLKIVEELLAAGAKLDPLVFDSYLLPLHMAINKGHTAIAKLLIEKGGPQKMATSRLWRNCWQQGQSWTHWCLTATCFPCTWPSTRITLPLPNY